MAPRYQYLCCCLKSETSVECYWRDTDWPILMSCMVPGWTWCEEEKLLNSFINHFSSHTNFILILIIYYQLFFGKNTKRCIFFSCWMDIKSRLCAMFTLYHIVTTSHWSITRGHWRSWYQIDKVNQVLRKSGRHARNISIVTFYIFASLRHHKTQICECK